MIRQRDARRTGDCTGIELARLRAMTLARWEPWLFDTRYLRPWDAQTKIATARRRLIAVPGRLTRHARRLVPRPPTRAQPAP